MPVDSGFFAKAGSAGFHLLRQPGHPAGVVAQYFEKPLPFLVRGHFAIQEAAEPDFDLRGRMFGIPPGHLAVQNVEKTKDIAEIVAQYLFIRSRLKQLQRNSGSTRRQKSQSGGVLLPLLRRDGKHFSVPEFRSVRTEVRLFPI
jgi:hypothetical protein